MIKSGDKLWHVPSWRGSSGHEVVVGKVGRVWADIGLRGAKMRVDTMQVVTTSGTYNSRCWLSESEYLQAGYSDSIRLAFRHAMARWKFLDSITDDQIRAAADALGIVLPDPPK